MKRVILNSTVAPVHPFYLGFVAASLRPDSLLRASHIKPWRDCTNHAERLDRYNGLLLSPNHDAAFDRGLISFDDEGRLLLSPRLSAGDANLLGLSTSQRLLCIVAENRPYLAFHRQLHGF